MAFSTILDLEEAEQIEQDAISFIRELALKAENQNADSSWYIIAACAFTAAGQGPLVAELYKAAIAPFASYPATRRNVLRRIKESLITSSFIFGVPRLLNAFSPLKNAIPDASSNDNTNYRISPLPSAKTSARGEAYMRVVFGSGDLSTSLTTMEESWPDLKALIVNNVYGMYQAEVGILGKIETSMINIASLVPMDCPAEVGWHMRGLVNNGGGLKDVEMAFGIAKEISKIARDQLKRKLPEFKEVVGQERLISSDG